MKFMANRTNTGYSRSTLAGSARTGFGLRMVENSRFWRIGADWIGWSRQDSDHRSFSASLARSVSGATANSKALRIYRKRSAPFVFSFYDVPNVDGFLSTGATWLSMVAANHSVLGSDRSSVSFTEVTLWLERFAQSGRRVLLVLDGFEKVQEK